MLNKLLASFKIGSAEVDTILGKTSYRQGETIKGQIVVKGGSVEQEIHEILLALVVDTRTDKDIWEKVVVSGIEKIHPKEIKRVEFEMKVPETTPISYPGKFSTYLKTGLDISFSLNPNDKDEIEIQPHPYLEQMIQVVQRMGFSIKSARKNFWDYGLEEPFYQDLELRIPAYYSSYIDEVTIAYLGKGSFVVEVDRKTDGSVEDLLDLDEVKIKLHVTDEDIKDQGARIEALLVQRLEEIKKKRTVY